MKLRVLKKKIVFSKLYKFASKYYLYIATSCGVVLLAGLDVWQYSTAAMVGLFVYGLTFNKNK